MGGPRLDLRRRWIQIAPVSTERRLEMWLRFTEDRYAPLISAARKAGDSKEAESLKWDERWEVDMLRDEQDTLFSRTLLARARRLRVPVPERDVGDEGNDGYYWYESRFTGALVLTVQGVAKVRKEIHEELKARQERRSHWVTWIGAVTGLVGAATGLVAVLHQMGSP